MTNANLTHLVIVADRSGSMASIAKDMNGGIHELLKEQTAQPGDLVVDIVTFDDTVEKVLTNVRLTRKSLALAAEVIKPRGRTALNDALGGAISDLSASIAATEEDERPGKVIFVVVTDGYENASREWTTDQVGQLVDAQRAQGWEFVFLAANIDAFAAAQAYGFNPNQTMSYVANAHSVANAYGTASSLIARSRAGGDAEFSDMDRKIVGGSAT